MTGYYDNMLLMLLLDYMLMDYADYEETVIVIKHYSLFLIPHLGLLLISCSLMLSYINNYYMYISAVTNLQINYHM